MAGYVSLLLHAHLPFVRHPEHEWFLEENWLFEAITETYLPLLQVLQGWRHAGMVAPVTLTLTPTLCEMLRDPLLRVRYQRHLNQLIELAEKETHRTLWEKPFHELARFYLERFTILRSLYDSIGGDLVGEFSNLQQQGFLEIITCAATHALLPLLAVHPPSLRAQILVARDNYRACFGKDPRGIWLPECAYVEDLEPTLAEAGIRWFVTETQGILRARPRPRYGMFAPILTPRGLAVFGRDMASAKQVWSRNEGYPGDPRYRDFYRDAGFDLDLDYLRPYQATGERRGFTGIKYHQITGNGADKKVYDRRAAIQAADNHAADFLAARIAQVQRLNEILDRPPLILCPYDAELFGHWWYEGPEFLDFFVRKAYYDQRVFSFITPDEYLHRHPTQQVATPAASSWGEGGFWRVWLNENNEWIYPHLQLAQQRMSEMAQRFSALTNGPPQNDTASHQGGSLHRALQQAGRELLLAQSSDWPFILKTGTSPEYARRRVKQHVARFTRIYTQVKGGAIDEEWLGKVEASDNLFGDLRYGYWC